MRTYFEKKVVSGISATNDTSESSFRVLAEACLTSAGAIVMTRQNVDFEKTYFC